MMLAISIIANNATNLLKDYIVASMQQLQQASQK